MMQRTGRRAASALAALAAVSMLATACGSGTTDTASGKKKVAVSLITKTSTNPFFVAMQEGAKKAAEAEGVTLTFAAGKYDGDEPRPGARRSRTPSPAATRAS